MIEVDCYAGYQGDETPRRLRLDGREVQLTVVERWRTPDHRHFKVLGDDGEVYRLRQSVVTGAWEFD